jgi:hypothetical protein
VKIKTLNKYFQLILVFSVCFVCISNTVSADGIYIPEKAYAKLPDMPFQRAALIYRDNTETLIIESSFNAEGRKFGWIIPLPAVPIKIEEVSPGFLKTLSQCIQPIISHDQIPFGSITFFAILITIAALSDIFRKKKESKGCSSVWVIIIFLFLFFGLSMGSSAGPFSSKAYQKISGINVQSSSQVGNYSVAVLNAANADVLNSWLNTNGFAKISESGKNVVTDYITNGWCFVTAKLQREGSGFSSPHPLMMSFKTQKAVYPMKLTALANSELYLELFVCADKKAEVKGLELNYCDRHIYKKLYLLRQKFWGYSGEKYYRRIYHPFAENILWTNCVITKLSAELLPKQMNKDYEINFKPFKPFIQHLYSFRGALKKGALIFIIIWIVGLITVSLSYNYRKKHNKDVPQSMWRIVLLLFCTATFIGLIIFITVPKIKVVTGKGFIPPKLYLVDMHRLASKLLKEHPAVQTNEIKIIEQKLINIFNNKKLKNAFTGEIIKAEDSPGNFVIERKNGKVVMKVYYIDGAPVKKELPF